MENFILLILLKQQQKRLENQSDQGWIAEVMQQPKEMLRQINSFLQYVKECVK
jgi:hypothetical protein